MRIVILGAGLVGKPMAMDLALEPEFEIVVVDRQEENLNELQRRAKVTTIVGDATNPVFLEKVVAKSALCINALPGFLGFQVLKKLIELKKNIIDIAFAPEDPLTLNDLAQKQKVTALVDCGVAPGMSNLLVGFAQFLLGGKVEQVKIYVGGLPKMRQLPWEYKAVFSPVDVIEEYLRPARFKQNGKIVVKEALTDPELIDFPQIGTLEAFNSDGLRTLLNTIPAPNMVEKTLRYPGYRDKILLLKQSGLLDQQPVTIDGHSVRPIDVTCKALFKQWQLQPGEEDLTVMRVEVTNRQQGICFDLLDYYDHQTGIHSMARTTGFTATVMARAVLAGMVPQSGILPLEKLGQNPELVQFVLNELAKRGVKYQQSQM